MTPCRDDGFKKKKNIIHSLRQINGEPNIFKNYIANYFTVFLVL